MGLLERFRVWRMLRNAKKPFDPEVAERLFPGIGPGPTRNQLFSSVIRENEWSEKRHRLIQDAGPLPGRYSKEGLAEYAKPLDSMTSDEIWKDRNA